MSSRQSRVDGSEDKVYVGEDVRGIGRREETRVRVMIHPEVGVINSQSLCGPRVGRQEEIHAGLSRQASAFYTISFSGQRRWGLSLPLRFIEVSVRPMWVPQN